MSGNFSFIPHTFSFYLSQNGLGFLLLYRETAEGCFHGYYSLLPPSLPTIFKGHSHSRPSIKDFVLLWLAETTHWVPIFLLPFFHSIAFLAELPRKIKTTIFSLHCSYSHKTKFWPVGCKQDNVMASRILKRQQKRALFSILSPFCFLKHGCRHLRLDDEAIP